MQPPIQTTQPKPLLKRSRGKPTIFTPITNGLIYLNNNVITMNSSKYFAGIVMIFLNVGSKFIPIQFSKSTEEYLKRLVTKQLLVFSMAWMGTRDIYTAIILTIIFTILSDIFFNEEHTMCVVPHKYRILDKLIDTNDDGEVDAEELAAATKLLEKAKKDKIRKDQKTSYKKFDFEKYNYDK